MTVMERLKILVVDDEPKIREVIKEYAEFNGYEVTEAEDGMSALGRKLPEQPDLALPPEYAWVEGL